MVKLLYAVLVLVLVVCLVSGVVFLSPVDPAQLTFGQRSDAATVAAKKAELGLDAPLYVQLFAYLADLSPISIIDDNPEQRRKYHFLPLLRLKNARLLVLKMPYLRESFQSGRPVWEILAEAAPATAMLALCAFVPALVWGLALGGLCARWPNSHLDRWLMSLSVLGYAVPSYVVALLLALLLAYAWGAWTGLPVQGPLYVLSDFGDWELHWENMVLPALALGMRPVALFTQLTRSTLLDVLGQDYVRTAVAKGLPPWRVWWRHALPNALNPVVSAATGWLGGLLSGAFFVENVFAFKGLGEVTVSALKAFDLPVVLGCVLFTACVFVVLNLLTDVLYRVVDPRVR
jgi:peptide/nickel transport system permease protein